MSASRVLAPKHSLWSLPSFVWLVVMVGLLACSHAARAADRNTEWRVMEVYMATVGYAPDGEGFDYWVGKVQNEPDWTPTTVAQSFFDQPLVQEQYPASMGNGPLIEALYQNIFGRAADPEGYNYWLGELENGRVQRNQMIIALINGGWENQGAATDMARFGNRVSVALKFARYQTEHGIVYGRLSAEDQAYLRQAGRTVIEDVGADSFDVFLAELLIDGLLARLTDTDPDTVQTLAMNTTATGASAAVYGISGSQYSSRYFKVTVPDGVTNLVIQTEGEGGNPNLYVERGSKPTLAQSADAGYCASINAETREQCTYAAPLTGDYYILIYGASAYFNLSLTANWKKNNGDDPPVLIEEEKTVTALGGEIYYENIGLTLSVPSGMLNESGNITVKEVQDSSESVVYGIEIDPSSLNEGDYLIEIKLDNQPKESLSRYSASIKKNQKQSLSDALLASEPYFNDKFGFFVTNKDGVNTTNRLKGSVCPYSVTVKYDYSSFPLVVPVKYVHTSCKRMLSSTVFSPYCNEINCQDRIPVLMVHGFNMKDGYISDWELMNTGIDEDYWTGLKELLWKEGYAPYFFRWRTAQRFSDAAEDLGSAVDELNKRHPNQKPLIVAHSFGGLVARTYAQGYSKSGLRPNKNNLRAIMTIGTPHSGIFSDIAENRSILNKLFPLGIDGYFRAPVAISQCRQISCYQAGSANKDTFNTSLGSLEGNLTPETFKNYLGVAQYEGELIYKLAYPNTNGLNAMQVPLYAFYGLGKKDGNVFGSGDNLISWQGQRVHPELSCSNSQCSSYNLEDGKYILQELSHVFSAGIKEAVLGARDQSNAGPEISWMTGYVEYGHTSYAGTARWEKYQSIVTDAGHDTFKAICQVLEGDSDHQPLNPPSLNTPKAESGQVLLTWSSSDGATSYYVAYGLSAAVDSNISGTYINKLETTGNSLKITGLENGIQYYFSVSAIRENEVSDRSNVLAATPQADVIVIDPPILNSPAAGDGRIALSWSRVDGAIGYEVFFSGSAGINVSDRSTYIDSKVVDTGNSFTVIDGLRNGQNYYFGVTALFGGGEATDISNITFATPKADVEPLPNDDVFDVWKSVDRPAGVGDQWHEFEMRKGDSVTLVATMNCNCSSSMKFSLYRPNVLSSNFDSVTVYDGKTKSLSFTAQTKGTYSLKVSGVDGNYKYALLHGYMNPGVTDASRKISLFPSWHSARYLANDSYQRNDYALNDWYRFEVEQGSNVSVTAKVTTSSSSSMTFKVYRSNDTEPLSFDSMYLYDGSQKSLSFTAVYAGVYYLEVSGASGSYEISASGIEKDRDSDSDRLSNTAEYARGTNPFSDDTNNDEKSDYQHILDNERGDAYRSYSSTAMNVADSITTAIPIDFNALYHFDRQKDVSRYLSFYLHEKETVTFVVTGRSNGSSIIFSLYEPEASYGSSLTSVYDGSTKSTSYTAKTSGTYTIKVSGSDGNFDFAILQSYLTDGVVDSLRSMYPDWPTARSLASGSYFRNERGLNDWYRFQLNQSDSISISAAVETNSSNSMTFKLYRPGLPQPNSFDSIYVYNGGLKSISFVAATEGIYYLQVSGVDGRYTLTSSVSSLQLRASQSLPSTSLIFDNQPAYSSISKNALGQKYAEMSELIFGNPSIVLDSIIEISNREKFVFVTDSALLAEDTNELRDIYYYDAITAHLALLSSPLNGAPANADSHSPHYDKVGNRVVFLSRATNLPPSKQSAAQQIYQVDLDTGLIRRLSETLDGQPANGDISQLELASEAGKIVFRSEANNLDGGPGLYLQDLDTGLREVLVSSNGSSPTDPQAERPAIDANASLLAYDRQDLNGQSQIQTLELATRTERQETPLDAATVSACCARISSDGRYLAWRETDIDGRIRLRLRDEATGKDALIDWPDGVSTDLESVRLEFREDGRELWWIPVEWTAERPEVLHQRLNPVFVPPEQLH